MVLVAIVFIGLFLVVPISLTVWLLIYAARSATRMVGVCRRCGYDLRACTRGQCPECGQPYVINERGEAVS